MLSPKTLLPFSKLLYTCVGGWLVGWLAGWLVVGWFVFVVCVTLEITGILLECTACFFTSVDSSGAQQMH